MRVGDAMMCHVVNAEHEALPYPNFIVHVDHLSTSAAPTVIVGRRAGDTRAMIIADAAFDNVYLDKRPTFAHALMLVRADALEVKIDTMGELTEMSGDESFYARLTLDNEVIHRAHYMNALLEKPSVVITGRLTPWEIMEKMMRAPERDGFTFINIPCVDHYPIISAVGTFLIVGDTDAPGLVWAHAFDDYGEVGHTPIGEYFTCPRWYVPPEKGASFGEGLPLLDGMDLHFKRVKHGDTRTMLTQWEGRIALESLSADAVTTLQRFYTKYSVMPVNPEVHADFFDDDYFAFPPPATDTTRRLFPENGDFPSILIQHDLGGGMGGDRLTRGNRIKEVRDYATAVKVYRQLQARGSAKLEVLYINLSPRSFRYTDAQPHLADLVDLFTNDTVMHVERIFVDLDADLWEWDNKSSLEPCQMSADIAERISAQNNLNYGRRHSGGGRRAKKSRRASRRR